MPQAELEERVGDFVGYDKPRRPNPKAAAELRGQAHQIAMEFFKERRKLEQSAVN